jgi:hypothetical protein
LAGLDHQHSESGLPSRGMAAETADDLGEKPAKTLSRTVAPVKQLLGLLV